MRHGARRDPGLLRNLELGVTLAPELDHRQVAFRARLAAALVPGLDESQRVGA